MPLLSETSKPGLASEDMFRATHRSWMLDRIQSGEQSEVIRHVMAVYSQPLQAYIARSRYVRIGEPAEIVNGFFANRLSQPNYLERWHEDGRLLRDWLRVGLIFWAREFTRRENKQRGIPSLPDSIIGEEREPHEKMQNAFAANITRLAMEETAEACRAAGQEPHWRAFCLHYYEGLSYRAVGSELGLTDTQAEVRAHAPRRRFRRALRGHLQRDGIAPENLDRELKALIDDLRLK